ncbi:MAG: hypothetical protein HWN67_01670 [Candidatus Helarchaeota archaeon]|nr:hypothetical protein [Candidatus Helarchaeota archaeon]
MPEDLNKEKEGLTKAKESFIKKILENKTEALLAKKYCSEIEELIKAKKIISIDEVSKKLNLNNTDVRTIFEELILYNVITGKIEKDQLILD